MPTARLRFKQQRHWLHTLWATPDDATDDNDEIYTVMHAGARDGLCPWEIVEQKQADWRLYVLAKQEEMILKADMYFFIFFRHPLL